jgi:hypothetical protein
MFAAGAIFPTVTYITSLGGVRWENWRHDWVIARTEVSDRLALLSDGPSLSGSSGGKTTLGARVCAHPG